MATNGNEIALGSKAPGFRLPEPASGKLVGLDDFSDAKAVLIAFYCNHCPYVIHIRQAFNAIARLYAPRGVQVIAINPNDVDTYPSESADLVAAEVASHGLVFPYLRDDSQAVAKAYGAACTPELFLYDGERHLTYHGQFDDTRPRSGQPASGDDLRNALDRLLSGQPAPAVQKPAAGCSIKWKLT